MLKLPLPLPLPLPAQRDARSPHSIDAGRRRFGGFSVSLCGPALAAALALAGCATRDSNRAAPAEAPRRSEASSRTQALARLAENEPGRLAVGTVQPADDGDDALASGGTARALRDTLVRDLGVIGVLDAAAGTRLDAVVGWRRGGFIEARITLTRAGHPRLDKRYRTAPPTQPASESDAVRSLLDELYDDPEFNLAVKE